MFGRRKQERVRDEWRTKPIEREHGGHPLQSPCLSHRLSHNQRVGQEMNAKSSGGHVEGAFVKVLLAVVAMAVCLVAMMLWSSGSALAAPADRASALSAYKNVLADQQIPTGWTGSTSDCTVGTESDRSLRATLDTVNILRSFAGVEPVTFDPRKNRKALAAALIMQANWSLSHDPSPSWRCYSRAGAEGAGSSNLASGSSGAGAMLLYAEDRGVKSLGHRHWLFDPGAVEFGSGSTWGSNALFVHNSYGDGSRAAALPSDNVVAWPGSSDWFPWPWVPEAWSVAIGKGGNVTTSDLRVNVQIGGKAMDVSEVRLHGSAYGTGRKVHWQVDVPASLRRGDHRVEVEISGVSLDGEPLPISYSFTAFDPTQVPPPGCTIKGTPGDDVLKGTSVKDVVCGMGGNDTIYGLGGNDVLRGGDGNDRLVGGSGDDKLYGQNDSDFLFGIYGEDYANGGRGNDVIRGNQDNDRLVGTLGNDTVIGGKNDDTMFGGPGRDRLYGQGGQDRLFGISGPDYANGGSGNDLVRGDRGNDRLVGFSGNDRMIGGEHNDTMFGGPGRDRLYGQRGRDRHVLRDDVRGNDYANGGSGRDRAVRDPGDRIVNIP